jgi:cyclophilin family peptidyl-prolyl cis-trans isomerase
LFEPLEQRLVLAPTPLPTLGDLESSQNTVVRLETNMGTIDIELFNAAAPITVENFLRYVTSGRLDETFFHRSVNNFVIQGGGYTYRADRSPRLQAVQTDPPIVREQSGRSNLARTVAMARTNDPNSATSQFFINLEDNISLNTTGGGYTVFGRVIGGWSVVQAIAGLNIRDLTANEFFAGPHQSAMGEVPVTSRFDPDDVQRGGLVQLVNAEVIKPADVAAFYGMSMMFPDGRAGAGAIETLRLTNPNASLAAYQVIVRYESGLRDLVIASGTLDPHASTVLRVSDFRSPDANLVRSDVGYAIFVESGSPGAGTLPVVATWTREDFGSRSTVELFRPFRFSDEELRAWAFPYVERNFLSVERIHWQNLSPEDSFLTIEIYQNNGVAITLGRTVEGHRQGSLLLSEVVGGFEPVSVKITSTSTIAASVGDWDIPVFPGMSSTPGWMALGVPNAGLTTGALAAAASPRGYESSLAIVNPTPNEARVVLQFIRSDIRSRQNFSEIVVRVPGWGRLDYPLTRDTTRRIAIPDARFGVRYISSQPIAVAFRSEQLRDLRGPVDQQLIGGLIPFQFEVGTRTTFAGGFVDPQRVRLGAGRSLEVLSIWSPYRSWNFRLTFNITFTFADGTSVTTRTMTLRPYTRVNILTATIPELRAKLRQGSQFHEYTMTINYTNTFRGQTVNAGAVAQLTRHDGIRGELFQTYGQNSGEIFRLNNPGFNAS